MRKKRARREGRQLGLYVPLETAETLKTLSERTDIPQSRLLRQALRLLFDKYADVLGLEPEKPHERLGRSDRTAISTAGDGGKSRSRHRRRQAG